MKCIVYAQIVEIFKLDWRPWWGKWFQYWSYYTVKVLYKSNCASSNWTTYYFLRSYSWHFTFDFFFQ